MFLGLAACSGPMDLAPSAVPLETRADQTLALTDSIDPLVVGDELMALEAPEQALQAYTRAALLHGLTGEVLASLAAANYRLGRLGQAEELYRRAVEREDPSASTLNNLGVVLLERGQNGEASRFFERAMAIDTDHGSAIAENHSRARARMQLAAFDLPSGPDPSSDLVRLGPAHFILQ